jgi:hypothetical protein
MNEFGKFHIGFGELVVLLSTSARVEQLAQATSCSSPLTSLTDNFFLQRLLQLAHLPKYVSTFALSQRS